MDIRIQKYLSEHGMASRREAERLLLSGAIKINGVVVRKLGTKINPELDRIEVISSNLRRAILMYKPRGYVTTKGAKEGKTIYSLLPKEFEKFSYIGRLDKESEGLLILTDDGVLASRLTDAKYATEKEYEVFVQERLSEGKLAKLRTGIRLSDGVTKPARVKKLSETSFRIVLTEGRNRQIRRMCDAAYLTVRRLVRVRIKNIEIRGLKSGAWRELSAAEIKGLK